MQAESANIQAEGEVVTAGRPGGALAGPARAPVAAHPAAKLPVSVAAPLIFFLVYAFWICWLLRAVLVDPTVVPTGDTAADDMLILKAKHLALLHGNYSRVGFYHPGPFFLQWAAFGEIVLHDWLGWVKSAHAAQVLAIDLLHGVALAFALRFWLVVTRSLAKSLLAVTVLMAAILWPWDSNLFAVPWNPHSYVAAALWLATGLVGIALRGARWTPLAALGCAALLEGHASFIGLLPLCLAGFAWPALGWRWPAIPSRAAVLKFLESYRWSLAASIVILAIGALPIALNTALNWPGELPKYFLYTHKHQLNDPLVAIKYVWTFVPLAGVWLYAFLPPRGLAAEQAAADAPLRRAGAAALLGGLVPALFYSLIGVDRFAERYLILWVVGFVGMAAAAAALLLADRIPWRWARVAGFAAVAGVLVWLVASRPEPETNPVANRAYVAAAKAAEALAPPGEKTMLIVSHDQGPWMETWEEETTLNALLLRDGSHAVCVDPGSWVLPFGLDYRCEPTRDRIARTLYFGPLDPRAPAPALRLYEMVATDAEPSPAGVDIESDDFFRYGITARAENVRPAGVRLWVDEPKPILAIAARGLSGRVRVTITGEFVDASPGTQVISLLGADGRQLAEADVNKGVATGAFDVDLGPGLSHGPIEIRARIGRTALVFDQGDGRRDPQFDPDEIRLDPVTSQPPTA
jgi:hypothetical protein